MAVQTITKGDPNLAESFYAEQGKRKSWSYFSGEVVERTWKGTRTLVDGIYENVKVGNDPDGNPYTSQIPDAASIDEGRGLATLNVQYAEDGEAVYELMANEIAVPVHAAPYFTSATAITADEVNQAYDAWDQKLSVADARALHGWSAGSKPDVLFKLLSLGTESFYYSTYVLRETKNVSRTADVSASYANVNRVTSPPSYSSVNALIGNVPSGQWLKKAPIVRQVAAVRWQIITEWWWDTSWSSVLYGGSRVP